MTHRIRRIGVLKAAVIGGIAYAAMGLLFVPFFLFLTMMPGAMGGDMGGAEWMMGPAMMLLMPLFYGVMGFITMGIGAAVYNLIAMMVGGIEVELEPVLGA